MCVCVCVFEGYTKVGVGKDCQSHTLPIKQKASNYLRWLESSLHGQQNIFSYCMESYTYILVSIKLGYFYIVYHSVYILIGLRKCKKLCTINF